MFSVSQKDLNEFLKGFQKELQEYLSFGCLDLGEGVGVVVLQFGLLFFIFLHLLSGVILP